MAPSIFDFKLGELFTSSKVLLIILAGFRFSFIVLNCSLMKPALLSFF